MVYLKYKSLWELKQAQQEPTPRLAVRQALADQNSSPQRDGGSLKAALNAAVLHVTTRRAG